ncbi:MAG: DNA polymerase III subunit delta [Bacilli bacterium]|nr:DNA polymerase III subunit delta [Bacilli bacterium]
MTHIFTGNDPERLKIGAINEIKEKVDGPLNDFNFATFDMFNDLIQDAVLAAEMISFTMETKFVLVYNCYFLTSAAIKVPSGWTKQQDLKSLLNYIKQPNPSCELYLIVPGKMLGERSSEVIKELRKKAKITCVEELKTQDLMELGMQYVGKNKADIDQESLFEVIARTGGDYSNLIHALDKLMLYTKQIDMASVNALVKPKLEDNVFSIVENLLKSHIKLAIKGYRDLTSSGYNAISLLPVFASQLRFIYKVIYLTSQGQNNISISKELKCNPYRIKITQSIAGRYSLHSILSIMADLGEMENHIKYDNDNPDSSMEFFMVNFRRKYLFNKA